MIQPEDCSPSLSLNLPELLTRVDHDRELLRELLGIFKEEFPAFCSHCRKPWFVGT
jgi:hypothetical protein